MLYRASFRQTFSEFLAPTGEWRGHIGIALIGVAFSLWIYIFLKIYGKFVNVYNIIVYIFQYKFINIS